MNYFQIFATDVRLLTSYLKFSCSLFCLTLKSRTISQSFAVWNWPTVNKHRRQSYMDWYILVYEYFFLVHWSKTEKVQGNLWHYEIAIRFLLEMVGLITSEQAETITHTTYRIVSCWLTGFWEESLLLDNSVMR